MDDTLKRDTIQPDTGELVGDIDYYVTAKKFIEGFFNNLTTDELINRAETSHGHPVAVVDLGFYLVCQSPSVANNPELHRSDDPAFLNEELSKTLRAHYLFQNAYKKSYAAAIVSAKPQSFIATTINISPTSVLLLLIFSDGDELTQKDLMNAKKATQLLTLQFQKDSTKRFYRPLKKNRTLKRILSGEQISDKELEEEKEQLPWLKETGAFYLMQIVNPGSDTLDSIMGSVTQMLVKYLPLYSCFRFSHSLLIFLNEDQYHLVSEEHRDYFEGFLEENQMYAVIGRRFTDIRMANQEYKKNLKLVEMAVRSHKHFALYSEARFQLIADHICENYDLQDFCHPAVLKLSAYDEENQSELYKTLGVYLKYREEQARILKELHIGKSTLFYRLGKIRDMTGVNLSDSEEVFQLMFTYKLLG